MYAKTALLVLVASLAYASAKGKESTKQKHLATIFDTLDANNDGKISLKEAEAFYEKVGLSDKAIEKAFKKADKNGDKFVTLKEFEQYAKNISVPSGEDILDVAFDAIDRSNDNYITLDEAKKFYSALGIPVADIEAGFKSIDKDGDGKISLQEFTDHAPKKN